MSTAAAFHSQLDDFLRQTFAGGPACKSVTIPLLELMDLYPDSAATIMRQPLAVMPAIRQSVEAMLNTGDVRLGAAPLIPSWSYLEALPKIEHQNRLLSVIGKITRTGTIKVRRRHKTFKCQRCKQPTAMVADDLQYGQISKPVSCSATIDGQRCLHCKFDEDEDEEVVYDDVQDCRIQEPMSQLQLGAMPRSMTLILLNELVDSCRPGDDVLVVGVMRCRWKPFKPDMKCDGEFFLTALNIQVKTQSPLEWQPTDATGLFFREFWTQHCSDRLFARNIIVDSVCPEIFGQSHVKLALLLTLIAGSSGRKEGHLLLVGDPGTAKSHFLRTAAALSFRAICVSGSGASTAGLTVAAVKDSADWHLEAGALVLADQGTCCIDEFASLRPADQTAIHESMEQQRLSIAKAGLVCKMNTRCSIIAACNARKPIEKCNVLSEATGIASPLLSRFDLIYVLLDRHDADVDSELAWHIIKRCKSRRPLHLWSPKLLKSYIASAKVQFEPSMSDEARLLLTNYYQLQRQHVLRDPARTTLRFLESLIRLSQAHAKLMQQHAVLPFDAVVAILLMDQSLAPANIFPHLPDGWIYRDHSGNVINRLRRVVVSSYEEPEITATFQATQ